LAGGKRQGTASGGIHAIQHQTTHRVNKLVPYEEQLRAAMLDDLIAVPGDIQDQAKPVVAHRDQTQREFLAGAFAGRMHTAAATAALAMSVRISRVLMATALALHFLENVFQLFFTMRGYPKHHNPFRSHPVAEHEQ